MSSPIRLGIVGAGAVTQVAHLPALKKLKGIEIAALADGDMVKASALGTRFQVPSVFEDLQDMLQHTALDALLVCTPNHLHEGHVLEGLRAGLHVMVEKPFATTVAGAERVQQAATKAGKLVMVGMSHRYRNDVQAVQDFIKRGALGDIESVQAVWHTFRPSRAVLGWRQRRAESGGGAMLDLGLTVLDLSIWLLGNPKPLRVSANFDAPVSDRAVEQAGSAYVVCEGGASIAVDVNWRHVGPGERFEVGLRGTKGTAAINPLRVWQDLNGIPTDVAPTGAGAVENQFTSAVRAEWAHFLTAIADRTKSPSLDAQVRLHRLMDAIYRSAEEGREVTL
ncbi:MAG TPA: Gfo/Idh/MocA family oxidoreductase [Gemmatimonadales bacterium]|nr:Gfo/Idh/MocA family oxidoreductase [Gemmatimonadales bacterium]